MIKFVNPKFIIFSKKPNFMSDLTKKSIFEIWLKYNFCWNPEHWNGHDSSLIPAFFTIQSGGLVRWTVIMTSLKDSTKINPFLQITFSILNRSHDFIFFHRHDLPICDEVLIGFSKGHQLTQSLFFKGVHIRIWIFPCRDWTCTCKQDEPQENEKFENVGV